MVKMATQRAAAKTEAAAKRGTDRVVTSNRRATHDYTIEESVEAGIVLTGTEIKSIRAGKVTISEAYARIENGELWLIGAHVSPYTHGSYTNHEPDRPRKLLVHKAQVHDLQAQIERKGLTLVPLRLSLIRGRAKIEIGVGRGKKNYDKRAADAERQSTKDIQQAMRDRGDR